MNELKLFESQEFGAVRTLEENGKILFCAKDVAAALGYRNTRDAISRHCKGVVKRDGVSLTTNQHGTTTEQTVEMAFIPEGDVYRLMARSELPGADKFESWIFDEVVPSIRKTGGYTATSASKELQAIFMLDSRTVQHEERITALEGNMVVDYGQQRTLAAQVNAVVIEALGGADSPAYRNKNIRGRTYSECNHDIQKWFRVNSRNNIPRKRFDEAVEYIQRWRTSTNLSMTIQQTNQS